MWVVFLLLFSSLIFIYDVSALDRRDALYYKSPIFRKACLELLKQNQCEYVRTIWNDVVFQVTSKFQDQELEFDQKLKKQRIQFEQLLESGKLDFIKQVEKMILHRNKERLQKKKERYILVDQLLNLKAQMQSLEEDIKKAMTLKPHNHVRHRRLDNLIETNTNVMDMFLSYYNIQQIPLQKDYDHTINSIDIGRVRI